jgi:hypothetical protein
MVSLMVNPPSPGDESFAQYEAERDDILASLKRRAVRYVSRARSLLLPPSHSSSVIYHLPARGADAPCGTVRSLP